MHPPTSAAPSQIEPGLQSAAGDVELAVDGRVAVWPGLALWHLSKPATLQWTAFIGQANLPWHSAECEAEASARSKVAPPHSDVRLLACPQVEVVEATVAHLRGKLARQDELLESQRGAVRAAGAQVAAQRNELADQEAVLGDSQALVAAQGNLLQQQLMDMQASWWGEVEDALTSCLICQLCRGPPSSSCWTCSQAAGVLWGVQPSAAGQLPDLSAAQGDLPQQWVRHMQLSAVE